MRTGLILSAALASISLVAASHCARDASADTTRATGQHVPVVIELYTSEGCSSCPPADHTFAEIAETARTDGVEIIPLAFHVDYWNYLGWSDPFSTAKNSDRQRSYARALSGRVYTPEAVVDGRVDMTGSDRVGLDAAIAESAKSAKPDVALTVRVDGKNIIVDANSSALGPGTEVMIALAQARAVVDVPRGENGGRKLVHTNIVRAFDVVRPDADRHARVSLTWPDVAPRADARAVVVVSDSTTKRVIAAATRTF